MTGLTTRALAVAAVFARVTAPQRHSAARLRPADWSGAWSRATGGFYESTPEQALEPPPPANSPRRIRPTRRSSRRSTRRTCSASPPIDSRIRSRLRDAGRVAPDVQLPDAYEFVIRPEQTWLLSENGPNTVRIYTDGRKHPAAEDLWPTYTGNNVGHWEKDTLVFHSTALKGVGSTILGRNGLVMSDKLETTTRIRLAGKDRLLVTLVLVNPEALTRPWPVAFTYTRLPAGAPSTTTPAPRTTAIPSPLTDGR